MVMFASLKQSVKQHPVEFGVATGLAAIGIGGAVALAKIRKKKRKSNVSRSRKSTRYRRKTGRTTTKRRRYTPHTAGKRRDTSRRRIRYTKNGQPYVIVASGKARFIKKKSAKTSRKRSGGRY